jgi:hypothetical protein
MTASTRATDGPVHASFGLSYSNYLVWPRTLMQSMPEEWQERFAALAGELGAAFRHIKTCGTYQVTPATEVEYGDLNEGERALLGVTTQEIPDGDDEGDTRRIYICRDGGEHEYWERALVPLPDGDPVPHYNRGRTYIEPAA